MTPSLLLLCAAATAVIAFSTSAFTGAAAFAFRRALLRLTPAAEARVLFAAALLPFLASGAIMTAALAPSFGWIVDHCGQASHAHVQPNICTAYHVDVLPAAAVIVLASLLLLSLLASVLRLVHGGVTAELAARALSKVASVDRDEGVRILPVDQPQAFVLGLLKPVLFVTRGLLDGQHREHLPPVLAHERAHIQRRDALRRAVAILAGAFHLPGLGVWFERRLARANEMAADAAAARAMGSSQRVASALVRLTRAHLNTPSPALSFGKSDVEARVARLLDGAPRNDGPHQALLLSGAALLFLCVAISADAVHHGVEIVLGLISG
jgi:Zn-dependent protease with chaperone function